MKPSARLRRTRLILSALAFGLIVNSTDARAAAPVVAKPNGTAAVTVVDNGTTWTLDNGIVKATVNRRTGDLETLVYRGIDTMGHDQGRSGQWEQDPSAAAKVGGLTQSLTIDPATNGGARAEVSVKGVTKGDPSAGLSPGSPGAPLTGTANCDLEVRYALGRGESGIYAYAIYSHPASYGPLNMPESRYIAKLSQRFDWISVDADRNMLECAPTDWGTGVVVHAKEQRILTKGVYKNSVEHKYSYTAVQYKIPAYGWSSTTDHIGVWFINPSNEYLGGGPTRHRSGLPLWGRRQSRLDYPGLLARHALRLAAPACNIPAGQEKWNKVVGPIFDLRATALQSVRRRPTPSDLETFAATAGNPIIPAAWTAERKRRSVQRRARAGEGRTKAQVALCVGATASDYPHEGERGNLSGHLVLHDPQARQLETDLA